MTGTRFETVGDCPDFASAAEQNGTVPLASRGFETPSTADGSNTRDVGVCAHCGLPIPGNTTSNFDPAEQHEPEYCCFGCRLAADILRQRAADGELGQTCIRLGLAIFLSLNVMIFTMWLWTQEVYSPGELGSSQASEVLWNLCRYACLVFSLPVLWLLGRPVAEGAWDSVRRGLPTTDLLLILGTLAAFAYSLVSTIRGSGPVYFEIGCAVLVFVTLGRLLEARSKQHAAAALESLEKLLPAEVNKLVGDDLQLVPLNSIEVGDCLVIRAGQRIPVDGVIARGTAAIDASILTGEARAVLCEPGDRVLGGTLNLDGDLTIEVTAPASGGTWQRLLDCMRAARQFKGRHQQLADRVARWFMPAVAIIALAALVYHTGYSTFDQGLLTALAVVLVACPCALGLATPLAIWAGLGAAARAQVLFRHGEALERLAGAAVVAFDKTCTLTDGRPAVESVVTAADVSAEEVSARTLAVASTAAHDLSHALVEYCRMQHPGSTPPCEVQTRPGRGLVATFDDRASPVYLGSARLMHESQQAFSPELRRAVDKCYAAALPLACVAWGGQVRAVYGFNERLRTTAAAALDDCQQAGLRVVILTGDHATRGEALAAQLDVPVYAQLLPEDKVARLVELRRQFGPVVMVGDGLNDAPALTAADVGMALGCGADVSRQSADVCLLGNDPARVPWALGLARQTVRVVRQNLAWSFGYNAVGIGLAVAGYLNPIWAAVAMVVGGLGVVGNSLRLIHYPQPSASTSRLPESSETAPRDVSLEEAIA